MNKYKVGDKIVLTVSDVNEKAYYSYYVFNNNDLILWEPSTDKYAEPLSTYTEPLERKNENKQKQIEKLVDKLHRQAAEITRLLAENKELKEQMKFDLPTLISEEDRRRMDINKARAEGAEAAWELARKIAVIPKDGGYGGSKLIEIFNTALNNEIFNLTYPKAAAKVAGWEKAKEEIKVGDVLEDIADRGVKCVATSLYPGNKAYLVFDDGSAGMNELDDFKKTGRHIDIDSFLKQIGG